MRNLIVASTLAALLTGPVAAVESSDKGEPQKPTCAWARYIDSFKMIDERTVILEQSPSRRYKATLANRCRDLKFEWRIAVKSHDSCLRPGDALIVQSPGDFKTRCYIKDIVLLPKQEPDQPADEAKSQTPE
jgi:hypothetical protein